MIGVIGRKMIQLTYGTVVALVASHTGTSIVIYSVITRCIVFARKRVTVVDIWKREINGRKICNFYSNCVYIQNTGDVYANEWASNFVLVSLNFFFRRSHSGAVIFAKYWYLKIKINVEHGKIFTWNRAFSRKMYDFFRKDPEHILTSL